MSIYPGTLGPWFVGATESNPRYPSRSRRASSTPERRQALIAYYEADDAQPSGVR